MFVLRFRPTVGQLFRDICARKRWFHVSSSVTNNNTSLASIYEKPQKVSPLPPVPKKKIPPYVKSLYVGSIATEVFTYPELDLGRLNILNEMVVEVERFINGIDPASLESDGKIPSNVLLGMKNLGLFGLTIPKEYGGLGFSFTETTCIMEALVSVPAIFHMISVHDRFIVEAFLKYASEEQKNEYLPKMALGEVLFGFALWEEDAGTDLSRLSTSAVTIGSDFSVSGRKWWVNNLDNVDKMLVFITTDPEVLSDDALVPVTCVIADKDSKGLTYKPMSICGLPSIGLYEVNFERVPVPLTNILGRPLYGLDMASNVLFGRHTYQGILCSRILKELLRETANYVISRNVFNTSLSEYELVQQQLSEVTLAVYIMESLTYLTAGILDNYEDPDTVVETAITKLYCYDNLIKAINTCYSLLGSKACLDNRYNKLLNYAHFISISEGTKDVLRLFISTAALEFSGKVVSDTVMKDRNPYLYPHRTFMSTLKSAMGNPYDLPNVVGYHIHPSLDYGAERMEYCVKKLEKSTLTAFNKWGSEVTDKQMDIARLTAMAVELYVMTAVLSRSSRSLCLGLRNCDGEVTYALSTTYAACEKIEALEKSIDNSPFVNNDENFKIVSKLLVDTKGYCFPHPLTRAY